MAKEAGLDVEFHLAGGKVIRYAISPGALTSETREGMLTEVQRLLESILAATKNAEATIPVGDADFALWLIPTRSILAIRVFDPVEKWHVHPGIKPNKGTG